MFRLGWLCQDLAVSTRVSNGQKNFFPVRLLIVSYGAFMLKITLQLLVTLIGAYWAGDMFRQNPRINSFINDLEEGYANINKKLESTTTNNALTKLKKFYGLLCASGFVLFYASIWLLGKNNKAMMPMAFLALFSFAGWFSLKWCMQHKKAVKELIPTVAKIVLLPIGSAFIDKLFNTNFLSLLLTPFQSIPQPVAAMLPHLNGPVQASIALSVFLCVGFFLYYIISWIMFAPIAFTSIVMVLFPVKLARIVDRLNPNNAFAGFTFLVFLTANILLIYL